MANENATQEEVDAAVASVQEAMKGLVAVEKPSTETPDDNKAGQYTNRARIYHNKSKRSENRRLCANCWYYGSCIGWYSCNLTEKTEIILFYRNKKG